MLIRLRTTVVCRTGKAVLVCTVTNTSHARFASDLHIPFNCLKPSVSHTRHLLQHELCGLSHTAAHSHDVCLATCPQPLPKPVLHRILSTAASFKVQYTLILLAYSSSLHLLPRLPVTSILPSNCTSITCFRRHFLCKMWPI